MKTRLFLSLTLFTYLSVFAGEYRPFTDKNGRTIEAKIIKLNSDKTKITLERKNKAKATVNINIFSESDQQYILSYKPNPSSNRDLKTKNADKPRPLKKRELRAIGKQYETDINNKEWRINKSGSTYLLKRLRELKFFYNTDEKTVKFIEIMDTTLRLELKIHVIPKTNDVTKGVHDKFYNGLAFLTSTGDVKYNSFINPHPVEIACHIIPEVGRNYKAKEPIDIGGFVNTLKSCGIPTFNLTPSSAREDLVDEVPKIANWVMKNGHKHDTTEPVSYYPEHLLEHNLKKVKKYF